jgi:hypothetical protein
LRGVLGAVAPSCRAKALALIPHLRSYFRCVRCAAFPNPSPSQNHSSPAARPARGSTPAGGGGVVRKKNLQHDSWA